MIAKLALLICSMLGVGVVATTPEQSAQWLMGIVIAVAAAIALGFEIIEGDTP